jgi:axial budding pattern protein 2
MFSAPSAILSTPGQDFSFQLGPNTFSKPPGVPLSYYATMADNTPLAAWISFNPSTLSFTGRTPPAESLIQPPQRFAFQVTASDVVGFAGAVLGFDIYVGTHQLAADENIVVLNATRGTLLSYTGLKGIVRVDGQPADAGAVSIASTPSIPPWLSVNKHTWQMTGIPPETAESTNFTVTLRDTFANNLNLTISIELDGDESSLFTGSLPNLTITPGKPFSFDLRPYLLNPQDTEVSVQTGSSHPWIRFNASTATLSGDAPEELSDGVVNVRIRARSGDSKKSASLSFAMVIRGSNGDVTPSATATTGRHPTDHPGGYQSLTGDGLGNGQFNPVLLAVLLPLLLLLALGVCALFWYFRRRKDRQSPLISTRDISGPLPGTFVTSAAPPEAPSPLPDFSKRFGKSFSADDVFGTEKKSYLDLRNAFLTRPDLPRHPGSMRLLPPSGSPPSDPDAASPGGSGTPAVVSGALGTLGTLRPGTRGKISSSLSSIAETSIGDLVDSRGLESVGNDSRQSFRDKIEINVPKLVQSPGPASTASNSPTEAVSTPRPDSSRTALETEALPLRPESRTSYYPPASGVRKLSWQWLKGLKGRRQVSRLMPGMKRLSEQPSVLTVDSPVPEKTEKSSPVIPVSDGGNQEKEVAHLESPPLPLPKFPSRASLSRPPTRRSGLGTRASIENLCQEQPKVGGTNAGGSPPSSLPTKRENSASSLPIPGETPAESLDIYDDIVEHNPFHRSKTWSTVPTTDEWVDETVSSLALSRSTSQNQRNWTVLQESPVTKGQAATALDRLPDAASSVSLPQVREREREAGEAGATPSRPATATTADGGRGEQKERPGLARKSQSMGVSLRSEGSKSSYAVFI